MSQDFTPREYQNLIIDHMIAQPRCAVWAGMGMGKTSASLAVESAFQEADGGCALAIGPTRVARRVWPTEAAKWRQFEHLDISVAIGTEDERHRALKRRAHLYTINYDNLPWLIEWCKREGRWPFSRVYPDEATRLKGFRLKGQGGARSGALGKVAHTHISRLTELTGTPSPNGLEDLWGQMWFVDGGARLGRTIDDFRRRWFEFNYDGTVTPKQHAQREIERLLSDVCITVDPADWFDLEKPIVKDIYVDLPPRARQHYDEMERRLLTEISGAKVEALTAAAKTVKCLQLANGAAYHDPDAADEELGPRQWVPVHDEKLEALDSLVHEWDGTPLLVAYQFRSDKARIMKAFAADAIDITTDEGFDAALRGQGKLWLAHPKSMGHGVDGLQEHCYGVVFFGHWWNLEEYQQIIERVGPVRQAQAGKKRNVWIYHIFARDTVDELVDLRRRTKAEVQELLLQAMKRRAR